MTEPARRLPANGQADGAAPEIATIIRPPRGLSGLNLRELWAYRELLYFLVWRDVLSKYKQTVFGFLWAVLPPFMNMVVFTVVFGNFAKIPSDGIPYPVFNFCAMVPWTYFSSAFTSSTGSVVSSANLITKVYFPRLIVPLAGTLSRGVDFAISLVILVGMALCYRIYPTVNILFVPVLLLLTGMTAVGVGMWLAPLNVKYRDIQHVTPLVAQLWMYATPVVYPLSMVPERYKLLMSLNPMAGLIEGYRSALLNRPWDWHAVSLSAAIAVLLFVTGTLYFAKTERHFADII
jgi:lipopolysaccharide transport system permease protein